MLQLQEVLPKSTYILRRPLKFRVDFNKLWVVYYWPHYIISFFLSDIIVILNSFVCPKSWKNASKNAVKTKYYCIIWRNIALQKYMFFQLEPKNVVFDIQTNILNCLWNVCLQDLRTVCQSFRKFLNRQTFVIFLLWDNVINFALYVCVRACVIQWACVLVCVCVCVYEIEREREREKER